MLFSYSWLSEYVKGDLPKPDKLADLLSLRSFEVEGVTKKGGDWILDIDVLPNRAHDALNHSGMAREIAAITNKEFIPFTQKKAQVEKGSLRPLQVTLQAKAQVPRYLSYVVEGIKIEPSPKWMRDRLESVGINSINNIVDITNYVMLETGQPVHVFDYDTIKDQKMLVRLSKKGEKIETLDGENYILGAGLLVIEDRGRLIDLAGVMGGKLSGVSGKTKNIVFQAANFNPAIIYTARKELGIITEASTLYASGIDSNLGVQGLERVLFLLEKMGGGTIVQIIDIYSKKATPKKLNIKVSEVEEFLGVTITAVEIQHILTLLDFNVSKKGNSLSITDPSRRLDISIVEDVMEEIGRMYGYEKIPAVFPSVSILPPERNLELFWQEQVRNSLLEAGFTEVYSYSFIGEQDKELFQYSLKDGKKLIEVTNPISRDFKYLRRTLIENMIKTVAKNQRSVSAIKIFEMGKVFSNKNGVEERTMIAGVTTGEDFYVLKGVVDFILERMGISDTWYDEYEVTPELSQASLWNPKRVAEIKIGQQEIGFLGEISKKILSNFKIVKKVVAFQIDMTALATLASDESEWRPTSKYPAVIRDIALLVPQKVKVVDVLNIVNAVGAKLVRDVDIFDMYEGKELGDDRKSLAFHIIYQSSEKTLTGSEVDAIHLKIIECLNNNPSWEVRE